MSTAAADVAHDLYVRHARQVYSLCLRRLGSREEAEDAAQTVFLNAFGALQRGSRPRFERAWLRRIAENVCRDRRVRSRLARDLHALEDVLASPEHEHGALVEIEQALATLSERQRRVILLREWHGLSYREIGAELGLSEAAAEAAAFRARRRLAERLRGAGAGVPLLGWLKPALGGAAAAAKVAVVVAAVGVGGAATGYSLTREESHGPPVPAAHAAVQRSVAAEPREPLPRRTPAPASRRQRPAPATVPAAAGLPAKAPAPEGPAPAPAPEPVPAAAGAASAASTPNGSADAPELPLEAPELPIDAPELGVEAPPLPTAETPALPPVEAPSLPPAESPVEAPPLPDVPTLP